VFTSVSDLPTLSVVVLPPPEYAPPTTPISIALASGFSATRTNSGSAAGNLAPGATTWRAPFTVTIVDVAAAFAPTLNF
jgi:hypothetical protein